MGGVFYTHAGVAEEMAHCPRKVDGTEEEYLLALEEAEAMDQKENERCMEVMETPLSHRRPLRRTASTKEQGTRLPLREIHSRSTQERDGGKSSLCVGTPTRPIGLCATAYMKVMLSRPRLAEGERGRRHRGGWLAFVIHRHGTVRISPSSKAYLPSPPHTRCGGVRGRRGVG